MIVKHNHFTIADEIKAQIKEKNSELKISKRTVRRKFTNLGYVSIHPRRVPLLRKVVFSNKTTIQMFYNTLPAWSRNAKPIALIVKNSFKVHI